MTDERKPPKTAIANAKPKLNKITITLTQPEKFKIDPIPLQEGRIEPISAIDRPRGISISYPP